MMENPGAYTAYCLNCHDFKRFAIVKPTRPLASDAGYVRLCPSCGHQVRYMTMMEVEQAERSQP